MKEIITIVEESKLPPYIGTGTVAERLSEVVTDDLNRNLVFPEAVRYTEIEIDTSEAHEDTFQINLWEETASEEQPGRLKLYEFVFTVEQNDPKNIMDKTLHTDSMVPHKLKPAEALFFAGLSFRALAVHNRRKTESK